MLFLFSIIMVVAGVIGASIHVYFADQLTIAFILLTAGVILLAYFLVIQIIVASTMSKIRKRF